MTTTTTTTAPAIYRAPHLASIEAREDAIREALIGKHRSNTSSYTEDEVNSLLQQPAFRKMIEIDTDLLENCMTSGRAIAAVQIECEQFKMRLQYLTSALTIEGMKTPPPMQLKPWTLAVLSVRQVAKEFGQTLTISTEVDAPLWTDPDQVRGDTKDIRSTFRCPLSAYTQAESVGFFDKQCSFSRPLLIQGYPTILPNGQHSFTITKFCLDDEQAKSLSKERKARLDKEAKDELAAIKKKRAEERAAKAAEKALAKATKKPRRTTKRATAKPLAASKATAA